MNKRTIIGVDIGGTKCAVTLSIETRGEITIEDKIRFQTFKVPEDTIKELFSAARKLIEKQETKKVDCIGISCGGPLNGKKGLIICPPNLPGWINIPIVEMFEKEFGVPTALQNDANAGALAEWLWGAAQGYENVVFLTFGTGMGAGFILNNRLYEGTNDLAGEVGHIRLEKDGPIGFGKAGSFEGYCSGGGIAKLGQVMISKWLIENRDVGFCKDFAQIGSITAQVIGEAAQEGNKYALEIFRVMSEKLGKGVSTIIDMLNPQIVVLGSIYGRQKNIIEPVLREVLGKETISQSLEVCEIVPTMLGEAIGDFAAAAVAVYHLDKSKIVGVI
jgi:glucokinase